LDSFTFLVLVPAATAMDAFPCATTYGDGEMNDVTITIHQQIK
jgi:hypothetical protein